MVIGSPILDGPQPVLRRMTSVVTREEAIQRISVGTIPKTRAVTGHQFGLKLSMQEKAALIAFL